MHKKSHCLCFDIQFWLLTPKQVLPKCRYYSRYPRVRAECHMIHGIHFLVVPYSLSVVKCVLAPSNVHAETQTTSAINFDRECKMQRHSIDLFVIIIIRVDCIALQTCISHEELNRWSIHTDTHKHTQTNQNGKILCVFI